MNTTTREKTQSGLSDLRNKNIAFFSTRPYEHVLFSDLLEDLNNANHEPVNATFFEHPLNASTAASCKGYSDVVVFVNDEPIHFELWPTWLESQLWHLGTHCPLAHRFSHYLHWLHLPGNSHHGPRTDWRPGQFCILH